jgi:hypothetical protein
LVRFFPAKYNGNSAAKIMFEKNVNKKFVFKRRKMVFCRIGKGWKSHKRRENMIERQVDVALSELKNMLRLGEVANTWRVERFLL